MKKSKSIRLVLLGSASLALAACDDPAPPSDGRFFRTVEECSAVLDAAKCKEGAEKSQQKVAAEAPRFNRKKECEDEFGAGNCESHGSGGSFMPMMMGFMVGNMVGNMFSQPVYRGPANSAVMPSGNKLYNVGSFAGAGQSASFRPTQIAQVQRGGFGGTASAFRSTSGG